MKSQSYRVFIIVVRLLQRHINIRFICLVDIQIFAGKYNFWEERLAFKL